MATLGGNNAMTQIYSNSTWGIATLQAIRQETPTVKTFIFTMPEPLKHLPGQHYELRLTSADGYQAARLYSAGSAADGSNTLELSIGLVPDGEVTPYMLQKASVGEQFEIRGPLGRFFVWNPERPEPALLIAGGTGVVPMRAILQAHNLNNIKTPIHLLYGARTYDDIMYKTELTKNPQVTICLSDSQPPDWEGKTGFITAEIITETLAHFLDIPTCFLCGRTPFVEAVSAELIAAGVPPARIKAERFGA